MTASGRSRSRATDAPSTGITASTASHVIALRSPSPWRITTVTVFRPSLKACSRIAMETRIPVSVLTSNAEPISANASAIPSTSVCALHARGAHAAEQQLVTGHHEAGGLLHAGDDGAHGAPGHLSHDPAALAAHVLVVVAGGLEALLAVAEL